MAKQNNKDEQHINVYVRIRPNFEHEHKSSYLEVVSKKELLSKTNYSNKKYVFDRVFDDHSTQQEIYSAVVSPLIPEVINGYNCTVFAYGQTGTGKTYTMEGTHDKDNQISAGIIPRSLAQIFKVLSNSNTESSIKVSYLELYNEELFDLLSQHNIPKPIRIFEDKTQKGSVILQGLEELSVTELQQVYKILERGAERRRIASTLMNSSSSRSHTVFTIVVHTRETTIDGEELVKTGKLNLVDLAGSENISKSGAVDKRAREAGNINQSLLTLGRVIKALTERSIHIPYRESKLTRILQDSLGGRTKTSLIATVSGLTYNMEETLNTLEYATRARCIQNRPEVNQKISRTALINEYSDTIERLQRDLVAMRTGTGVYVDEENYSKLVADSETQKVEITEKMTYIKKLENDISEYTEKLHTLQASWVEAANNIEALSSEKKILENDLILVKETNEKQIREIHEYKEKHNSLKEETEKLLSDMEIHSMNEDTLHRKVSYLYQTSQMNKNMSKNFYNMYNKLYLELISRIDKCMNYTLKSMYTTEVVLNEDYLEEMYHNIALQVNDLFEFSNTMRQYTSKHFQNKEVVSTRFNNYVRFLQSLTDSAHNGLIEFANNIDKQLHYLYELTTNQHENFNVIFPVLCTIREAAAKEANGMSDIIEAFQNGVHDTIENLIDENSKLNEEVVQCHEIIVDLEKKLNISYDNALKFITDMKQTRKLDFAAYESNHKKMRKDYSDFSNHLHEFKEATESSVTLFKTEAYNQQDALQKSVSCTITAFNGVNDQIQLDTEKVTKSLKECLADTSKMKTDIGNHQVDYKTALSDYETKVRDIEATDDEQYTTINKLVDSMSHTTKNLQTTIHGLIDKQLQTRNKVEQTTKETTAAVKDTLTYCNNCSQQLVNLLEEFCGCKLQYPTHAGDTPQKVQPKSSLYVKTLTKNCFKAVNKEENVQYVEGAEKENLSNALNIVCTEDSKPNI